MSTPGARPLHGGLAQPSSCVARRVAALDAAAGPRQGDTVLVAHSLGCLTAAEWLLRHPGGARGVLLVTPPDPAAASFPAPAGSFRSPRLQALPVPGLLVASESDPYCALPAAESIAAAWNVPVVCAGELAHINEKSGVGYWQQGRDLLTAFTAGLGGFQAAAGESARQ